MGWGVDIQDEQLVYRMGRNKRDGLLVTGWGVTFRDGALIYGIGC